MGKQGQNTEHRAQNTEQNLDNRAQNTERKPKATRDAYGEALVDLGRKRSDVVVLDADLSGSTKTGRFAGEFPERFFNLGVSEQDMIGTAAGLALTGKIPFASTFAVFETGRAWDQIRLVVCYSNTNVKLVASHSGITVGEDGASHQALEDIALMRALPNMRVIVPADAAETRSVINEIVDLKGPVYVRLGRAKVPYVLPEGYRFKLGKAHVFDMGSDVNIVAAGIMTGVAAEAAVTLRGHGIDAGVINMSTIKPLDEDTLLDAATRSRLIVTAEEHSVIGGLGSAVCEFLAERHPMPVRRIGVNDCFGCSGKPQDLLRLHGLTSDDIVKVTQEALGG